MYNNTTIVTRKRLTIYQQLKPIKCQKSGAFNSIMIFVIILDHQIRISVNC